MATGTVAGRKRENGMAKKIKMLKPGVFVDKHKTTVSLSAEDLQATAKAYDPVVYAAPLTIGHPESDTAPSYGKLAGTDFSDGFLNGDPAAVDPQFAEIVNKGYYDRVSLSLFSPTSPANPKPGVWYPRHLAFLGAAAPAVPGLGTVNLSEADEGVVEFTVHKDGVVSLGSWNDRTIARMFRNIKNWIIGKDGKEEADKVLDEWDLETITEEALRPEAKPETPMSTEFSESGKGDPMDPKLKEELERREADVERREDALKTQENAGKHTANVEFAEGLVEGGKLLPAHKAAVVACLDFAEGITTGDIVEFGEGSAKQSKAPAQILRDVFGSYPKIIEFGELAGAGTEAQGDPVAIPADLTKHV